MPERSLSTGNFFWNLKQHNLNKSKYFLIDCLSLIKIDSKAAQTSNNYENSIFQIAFGQALIRFANFVNVILVLQCNKNETIHNFHYTQDYVAKFYS